MADQVEAQLKTDRSRIAAEEAKKAKQAAATDLEQKTREVADLQEVLKSREEKLAEAQNAQAELIKNAPTRRCQTPTRLSSWKPAPILGV